MNRKDTVIAIMIISLVLIVSLGVFLFVIVHQNEPEQKQTEKSINENVLVEINVLSIDQKNKPISTQFDDFSLLQKVNGTLDNAKFYGSDDIGRNFVFDRNATELYLWVPATKYPFAVLGNETADRYLNPFLVNYTNQKFFNEDSVLFKIDKKAFVDSMTKKAGFVAPIATFYLKTYNIPDLERIQFISDMKSMSCKQLSDWQLQHIGENQDYSDLVHDFMPVKCGVEN